MCVLFLHETKTVSEVQTTAVRCLDDTNRMHLPRIKLSQALPLEIFRLPITIKFQLWLRILENLKCFISKTILRSSMKIYIGQRGYTLPLQSTVVL
jgi:hypothetical protein